MPYKTIDPAILDAITLAREAKRNCSVFHEWFWELDGSVSRRPDEYFAAFESSGPPCKIGYVTPDGKYVQL